MGWFGYWSDRYSENEGVICMTHGRTHNSVLFNLLVCLFFVSEVRMNLTVCLVVERGCVWCFCCFYVIRAERGFCY